MAGRWTQWTPLHRAAQKGHHETVSALLKAGADVNARNNQQWTPLHQAALNGHQDIVSALLTAGADVNARDRQQGTPLHLAALNGHQDIVSALLTAGADVNARDEEDVTPIYLAALNGHHETVSALLTAGADVNARSRHQLTPLHLAALNGHQETVSALLAAGADVNARSRHHVTPLHIAAQNGHHEIVSVLLTAGADVNARDNEEKTPHFMAVQNGHHETVSALLTAGADVNARRESQVVEDMTHTDDATSDEDSHNGDGAEELNIRASRQKKECDPVLVRFYEERGMAVASKNYPMIQEAAKEIGQTVAQVKGRRFTDDMAAGKSGVTGHQEGLGMLTNTGDSSVPLEIRLRGPAMQQLYSQACRQGARPVHSTRGLVVGQFRSGKTCVVRRLTGEKALKDEPITDGIEISPSVMTTTWRKAKEEPDEFKEAMAERLVEQQEQNKSNTVTLSPTPKAVEQKSDRKIPIGETGKRTLPLKEEASTQSQQTAKVEDKSIEEGVNTGTPQQTQAIPSDTVIKAEQKRQGDVTVKQQIQAIPDDVIMKAKGRLQGDLTDEQLGTAEHPRLSIWDFGGQATYYGSHQCFFTPRGIYILVMSLLQKLSDPVPDLDYKASADNLVTGRDYLDHWLNSVRTHGLVHGREHTGHPPVVLVLTNKDKVNESEIENYKKDILDHISGMAAGKHVLPKIFVVDNFDEDNSDIDELREYLREVAKSQWYMGQEVPITWLHLKSKLMDKRREDDPFCPSQDVVDLARSDDVGITDDSHVADILTFLHDLGDIIFIDEPVLRDHVALRPQVMIDVFKTIITVPKYQQDRSMGGEVAKMWRRLEKEGILSDKLLTIIWTKADQKMQKPFLLRNKPFLKRLMEKYYLICNATPISGFDDTMQGPEKEEIYFVPSLLASKPDDETLYPGHMLRCQAPLYVVFDNMFLPSGMFYRLQAICVRRFGLETSQVFAGCGRFPTDDAKQQFVVTKVKHYLKVELLSSESEDQAVFKQGLPVRKFLSSCLFEIKEKWIPSIQYDWCFGEESDEGSDKVAFHPLSDPELQTATASSRFPEDFIAVWMRGSGAQRMPHAENSGGTGPVMIEPTLSPDPVHTIGPVLDCMETCGGLSLTECDRIRHELTFVSRFIELVATVDKTGEICRRLLGASVEVCLPARASMFLREERGKEVVVLHVGDYKDKLVQPLLEKTVQSSSRYGVTVCEDIIEPGEALTDKILDHLLKRNARMVVPIITPQSLHGRHWSTLGYEFPVQNKNLVFPVFVYPEGTRERLLEVLGRRCAGMLDMTSAEVPMTEETPSSTKISLTASEILRKASSSVVLNTYKITPEGCTLAEDGVTLVFPEGCVETERSLSLEVEMLPIDDDLRKAFSAVTPVLTVHQEQEEDFLQPVRVSLPWGWRKSDCSADKTVLMERKPHHPQWTVLRLEFQETKDAVTFSTRHFCGIVGAKESGNDGESSTSSGDGPGNQEEVANQEVTEESISREPEKLDEAANQGVAEESIKTKLWNPDQAANQASAEESVSRKPGHQDEVAKQGVAEESTPKVSSTSASEDATEAFQVCWNRYTEDKVYLIINPNQARTDNNNIHLMCVHKDDDPTDFFRAANMFPVPPFHQRIVMGREERIDARFDDRKEVIGDPLDVSDGINFYFPPADCNRWSVGLILNNLRPAKNMYKGTVHFRRFSESGEQVTDPRRRIPSADVFLYFDEDEASRNLQRDGAVTGMSQALGMKLGKGGETKSKMGLAGQPSHSGSPIQQPKKQVIASVLLVNDRYGTFHGGTSTINRQVAQFLPQHGATVHCTALQASEQDEKCAKEDGVILHLPIRKPRDKRTPSLEWLTFDHNTRYPDIPQDLTCIVGHADVTSEAAKGIQEKRCREAKLIIFNHDMPEDTEHYKGAQKAMTAGQKVEDILADTKNADAVFSLGRRIYDHYETKYKSLGDCKPKEHLTFLPRPSPLFEDISVRPGGGEKVVLTVGRVTEVEKLKGHDLVARSMGEVAEKIPNVKLRVRGIDEDDWEASKKILEENLNSGRIKPTLLPCGTQEDIAQDMQQAHLVLMPSRAEPFGLIGLEAIAAGIPVLISDKSGLADMIKDLIKEKKCHPDMRHRIVETSVRESDQGQDAREWAKKIADTLEYSEAEFEKAAEFKKRLLETRYWEESHQSLLRVCGLID
ncbi:uncharacterized protein LOC144887132 [Branchiostoma floridae x Branchiostoma japonicum]